MSAADYSEALRPQFHFTSRQGWLNDPNGLVYHAGEYHLFYQHNPFGVEMAHQHWGHAVSPDLVHWRELPIALAPDEHGRVYSGSAVVARNGALGTGRAADEALVAFYTAAPDAPGPEGRRFTQCMASSGDRGRTWTPYPGNPILGHLRGENRDPKVFHHSPSGRWIMALYYEGSDFGFFASNDLIHWSHLSDLTVPGSDECPDLFELPADGDPDRMRWVFVGGNGDYVVGRFDGTAFAPEQEKRRGDWGANFYATQTFNDLPEADGRMIQIVWMRGGRYPGMPFNQQMTFPCALTLRTTPDGIRMLRNPVREIETLYTEEHRRTDVALEPGVDPLAGLTGDLCDLHVDIETGTADAFELTLRGAVVRYSSGSATISCLGCTAPLAAVNGRIRLRALLDRTSIELFANDGEVSMSSCFVPGPDDRRLSLRAFGGFARLVSLRACPLASAWGQDASE